MQPNKFPANLKKINKTFPSNRKTYCKYVYTIIM